MNTMDCKTCREYFPDLLLEPGRVPGPEASAHLSSCAECKREWLELRATLALMDEWTAPEPSAYFDSRVHAHLREAVRAEPEGLWERLLVTLRLNTGRRLMPALAGAFLFLLLLGGGTLATLWKSPSPPPTASPAVNDLKIFDNNAQAVQQMDILDDTGNDSPQS